MPDSNFDPDVEFILEPADLSTTRPPRHISSLPSSPNTFRITVTLTQSGWVVLSDTYYPGWRAYLDDQPAPIYPADLAFPAVAALAGTHTLTFLYEPRSFSLGLFISLIAFLLFLILLTLSRLRPPPPSFWPLTS